MLMLCGACQTTRASPLGPVATPQADLRHLLESMPFSRAHKGLRSIFSGTISWCVWSMFGVLTCFKVSGGLRFLLSTVQHSVSSVQVHWDSPLYKQQMRGLPSPLLSRTSWALWGSREIGRQLSFSASGCPELLRCPGTCYQALKGRKERMSSPGCLFLSLLALST